MGERGGMRSGTPVTKCGRPTARRGASWRRRTGVILGLALGATHGCSDTPAGLEDHEHAEVERVVLVAGGTEIAVYDLDDGAWTGEVSAEVGASSEPIEVRVYDHDGAEHGAEDELYIDVVIDETIARFEQEEAGAFAGRFVGVAAGETGATFRVMHGAVGSGHPVLVTQELLVRVE